jgi:poly(beta-D-mannuronate) C5 epimerase
MRHAERTRIVVLILLVALGLGGTATFAIGRAYRSLVHPTLDLPARPEFVSAPDPILRATKGLDPNSTDVAPGVPRPELRTIEVFTFGIYLSRGGQLSRFIPTTVSVTTPEQIIELIDDPEWIRFSTRSEVVLEAALIMRPMTSLVVAAPLRRLVLQTRSGVFLGGSEATLSFVGVNVEASDQAVPPAGEVGEGNRPFVVAQGGSMEITSSTFRYLGRDWNDSYGVSWTQGATGFATGSSFEHNFVGIFVATAIDVRFERNTVRDNALYGISGYEVSAGLRIENNVVEDNGRGGIMLTDHCTNSVVQANTVQRNVADGIMLDRSSDSNLITQNTSANNGGDGIVMSVSSANTVEGNTVRDNRVAISVFGDGSSNNVARGNLIDDNGLAIQGLDQADNTVLSNGDYWRPTALIVIWALTVAFVVGVWWLTRWCQRSRDRAVERARNERQHLMMTGADR